MCQKTETNQTTVENAEKKKAKSSNLKELNL